MKLDRRSFFKGILFLLGSIPLVGLAVSACGKSIGKTASTPQKPLNNRSEKCNDGATTAFSNPSPGHDHQTLNLTTEQIFAAAPGSYTVLDGDHSHTITLTAADFAVIHSGSVVQKMDNEGHAHLIEIFC